MILLTTKTDQLTKHLVNYALCRFRPKASAPNTWPNHGVKKTKPSISLSLNRDQSQLSASLPRACERRWNRSGAGQKIKLSEQEPSERSCSVSERWAGRIGGSKPQINCQHSELTALMSHLPYQIEFPIVTISILEFEYWICVYSMRWSCRPSHGVPSCWANAAPHRARRRLDIIVRRVA